MADLVVLDGALRIARVEYPQLADGALRDRLDELVGKARPLVEGRDREAARRLLDLFCGPFGFKGNEEDYGDPRNSYLNDVLERRTGIPISLCWIFIELARSLGFRAQGVGFPGHFLAKLGQGNSSIILDCYHGRVLSPSDCAELLASRAPGLPPSKLPLYLAPATPRAVLLRMVTNLRRIHEERGELDRVLRWLELQSAFGDPSPELTRDRGLLNLALNRPAAAIRLLQAYLLEAPEAADGDAVRARLSISRKLLAELN